MFHLRSQYIACWAIVALLSTCSFADDQLVNGDFETGDLTGWTDPSVIPTIPNAIFGAPDPAGAQDGTFAVRLALANGVSEASQEFPASPGDQFKLSGYMLTENQLPAGPSFGLLKIVFQDATGSDIQVDMSNLVSGQLAPTDNPGIESLPFCDAATAPNTWIFSEAEGIAPPGTESVVFLLLNVDFANGLENPIWFDNICVSDTINAPMDNILANPSFETGDATGWVPEPETTVPNATLGAPANVPAQDGAIACELRLASGVGELRQTFAAAPGDQFSLEGWMLTENVLPAGPSFGLYKIVFQDENGADLQVDMSNLVTGQLGPTENPGIESLPFCDAVTPADTWICSKAEGIAPAGTTQVVFLALNVDFANGLENPIWFDNVAAEDTINAPGVNLLTNGSFETGDFSGWTDPPPAPTGNATVGEPGVGAQGGMNAVVLEAESNVSEIRQSVPAAPGDEFSLTGFILTENPIPAGPSFGLLKIVFRDAMGNDLVPESITVGNDSGMENPGIDSTPIVDENTIPNQWIPSAAQGVAPAGTVEVLFLALNVDFAGGSNPIWFDSIEGCIVGGGCDFALGDVNQDNEVNLLDVASFVDVISNGTDQCEADINQDGSADLLDVQGFVELLSGGG